MPTSVARTGLWRITHSTNSSVSAEKVLTVPSMALPNRWDRSRACRARLRPGRSGPRPPGSAEPGHVGGLPALGARDHIELDPVALRQRLEAVAHDSREMDEQLLAAVLLDEAESLGLIEPLDRALLPPPR